MPIQLADAPTDRRNLSQISGKISHVRTPATAPTAPGHGQNHVRYLTMGHATERRHLKRALLSVFVDAETPRAKPSCVPFDGPDNRWRERAVSMAWIELGMDQPALSWPTPACGTPKCLNFKHLVWESPRKLAYPSDICVYCGMLAGTKDHLLPQTWTGKAVRRSVIVVPACDECNGALGDRYMSSVTQRRLTAHGFISNRKKRLLRMPEWSAAEIAELGPTLRSCVEKGIHDKKLTEARLAWPDDPDYDLRAMQLSGIENPYEIGLLT